MVKACEVGLGERPESSGEPGKLRVGAVGGARRGECEEADVTLEKVTAELVGRRLSIVLTVVCP